MSYILKGCRPAGGLQSFVQQRIFNGASHEQEPYGPRQEGQIERQRDECGRGVMVRGIQGEKRKKGEREVQVRLAVIDRCFVLEVALQTLLQNHRVERQLLGLRLRPYLSPPIQPRQRARQLVTLV